MVTDRPLREFLPLLAGNKPLTISRWGDHEWHALFGETNGFMSRDGYFYLPELKEQLWSVLSRRPPYRLALSTDDYRATNAIFGAELQDLAWHRDPFSRITGVGRPLLELTRAVRHKPLIVVGPPKYRRLRDRLGWTAFVDVPPKNAYLAKDHLVREVFAALDDLKQPALVSVSAGVCAPLIVDDLFRAAGGFHQIVDFGGVWGEYLLEENRERAG